MKYFNSLAFFLGPLSLFASISSDLNVALRSLQQIRTLIPERLSVEEFSVRVDRKAFEEKALQPKEGVMLSRNEIGRSHLYYSRWVISGEPIRILDSYQEFEYGPYWRYPTALEKLSSMQNQNPEFP